MRREGGWIPVVKQRGRQVSHSSWYEGRRAGLFMLFVDNLPELMDSQSLYDLFFKFGVVKDVFIPRKRRKSKNTRFEFVRYDCSISARVAEQKTNGLWVDDKSLVVKIAEYGNGIEERKKLKPIPARQPEASKPSAMTVNKKWNQGTDGRSFADVIKGTDSRCLPKTTIRVEERGNGWLFESMIMRLKTDYSVQEVKNELKKRDTFRKIRRLWREMVILDGNICSPMSFRCGRFKIVTGVMDPISTSLNLECKGRTYPIRVYEEQSTEDAIFSYRGTTTNGAEDDGEYDVSNGSMACRMKGSVELAVGGSWSHTSAVNETKDLEGNSNKDNTCVVKSSLPEASLRQR
ncbi:hypothetical protein ACSBR2_020998 [Camellia fascicularis]